MSRSSRNLVGLALKGSQTTDSSTSRALFVARSIEETIELIMRRGAGDIIINS
jgi:hypothetical protein